MISLRDVVIFFAGAEFFHTISHILLPFFIQLPVDMKIIEMTQTINVGAIILNAIVTLLLLWWAKKLTR